MLKSVESHTRLKHLKTDSVTSPYKSVLFVTEIWNWIWTQEKQNGTQRKHLNQGPTALLPLNIFLNFLMYFLQIDIWTWIYQSEMCHTIVNPSKYTQLKHILDKLGQRHTKLGKIKVSPLFKTNDIVEGS